MASTVIEPWESLPALFVYAGFAGWIAALWWGGKTRLPQRRLKATILQFACNAQIGLGACFAWLVLMAPVAWPAESLPPGGVKNALPREPYFGPWDPGTFLGDWHYSHQVAQIGMGLYFLTFAVSVTVLLARRAPLLTEK